MKSPSIIFFCCCCSFLLGEGIRASEIINLKCDLKRIAGNFRRINFTIDKDYKFASAYYPISSSFKTIKLKLPIKASSNKQLSLKQIIPDEYQCKQESRLAWCKEVSFLIDLNTEKIEKKQINLFYVKGKPEYENIITTKGSCQKASTMID